MSLPAPILRAVEAHGCFTGCYRQQSAIQVCVDPALGPETMFGANCQDCLTFHIGALARLLPPGTTLQSMAGALSEHIRTFRGYLWAVGGYHAHGPGFWLNAVCCAQGLFLVDGSRNRNGWSDLDALLAGFRAGVIQPGDPRMLDASEYESEPIHVDASSGLSGVRDKTDLMASPYVSAMAKRRFHRVSLIEFLPLRGGALQADAADTSRQLALGDVCPRCGAEVAERPLFSGTFIGCLC